MSLKYEPGCQRTASHSVVVMVHERPFVGVSRPRSWSRYPVFGGKWRQKVDKPAENLLLKYPTKGLEWCQKRRTWQTSSFEDFHCRAVAAKLGRFQREIFPEFVPESVGCTDYRSRPGTKFSISENISLEIGQVFPRPICLGRLACRRIDLCITRV